jgi:hypothetical protein
MTELDRLEAEAAELDAAQPGAPGAEPAPEPEPAADPHAEVRGILEALRAIARAKDFAKAAAVLSDDAIESLAGALAPVLEKYGLSAGDFFGKWKAEIMALLVAGPVVVELVTAFRLDLDRKAAAAAKEVQPEPAPAVDGRREG